MLYHDQLETPRLTTRFVTEADIETWLEYTSDPIATTYTAPPGKSPGEFAEMAMQLTLQRYAEGRLGLQALISKETGELIGKCGLLIQEVQGVNEVEVGYHLLRRHWGKGYATEAVSALVRTGFAIESLARIEIRCAPDNTRSQHVPEKLGFQMEGIIKRTLSDNIVDTMIWAMSKKDYESNPIRHMRINAFDLTGRPLFLP